VTFTKAENRSGGRAGAVPSSQGQPDRAGATRWWRRSPVLAAALVLAGMVVAPLLLPIGAGAQPADVAGAPVPFGSAQNFGAAPAQTAAPIVGMAATPSGLGYWIVGADGGIFTFGDAGYFGSMGNRPLTRPIVGMAATPDGRGYWEVASDGGIFGFGDAPFYGSMGGQALDKPIVGMAATPNGRGYIEVASDGGVFTFGNASFHGSMGGRALVAPVVGMAMTKSGNGYYEVAADGGVFTFGDARYDGAAAGLASHVVGISTTGDGGGYWLVSADGGLFTYGDARFFGSLGGGTLTNPVVGMATNGSSGYWLLPAAPPPPPPALSLGSSGAAVTLLQTELTNLGYWTDTPNGSFGDATQQAVWALQKAAGLPPTGVTDPATWAALAHGVLPHPQSTSGYVIEVNLNTDLVMFVNNGQVLHVLNTSTGGGYTYDGNQVAITPQGHFSIFRTVDGTVTDSLGTLWRPRYFTGGYAIHGDSSVPPYPVSHGCVRVSDEAINWIWAANLAPIGTAVWVY
jgi:hypothetical protein